VVPLAVDIVETLVVVGVAIRVVVVNTVEPVVLDAAIEVVEDG
jgi:hypothetical protein